MNTHTHTKGPWRVIEHGKGFNRHCVGTSNTAPLQAVICEINTKSVGTSDEIRLSNARLIAAAPDLLEACKWFVQALTDGVLVRDITRDAQSYWATRMLELTQQLAKAQAAVLKAEGNA